MSAAQGGSWPIAPLPLFLDRLEAEYGPLEPSFPTDAVGLLLWENVAYLVDDSRRGAAFDALVASVGRQPADILAARDADLLAVVVGMRPHHHGAAPRPLHLRMAAASSQLAG